MRYIFQYNDFDLYHTLISGQCFEWNFYPDTQEWKGSIYGNIIKLKQIGDKHSGYLECESEYDISDKISYYFSFDKDYKYLIDQISFDRNIVKILEKLYGLRVIRQDPWFCINSFILSSNNTVKNIQNILRNIILKVHNDSNIYNFPTFEEIKVLTEKDLRECKAGFRSKYLLEFYKTLEASPNFISDLIPLAYKDAKNELVKIKGIGEKIADCILLYAYEKYEAYPIDTHLRNATHELYFSEDIKKPSDKQLRIWAEQYWSKNAGFAHFFLFTYKRLYGKV